MMREKLVSLPFPGFQASLNNKYSNTCEISHKLISASHFCLGIYLLIVRLVKNSNPEPSDFVVDCSNLWAKVLVQLGMLVNNFSVHFLVLVSNEIIQLSINIHRSVCRLVSSETSRSKTGHHFLADFFFHFCFWKKTFFSTWSPFPLQANQSVEDRWLLLWPSQMSTSNELA